MFILMYENVYVELPKALVRSLFLTFCDQKLQELDRGWEADNNPHPRWPIIVLGQYTWVVARRLTLISAGAGRVEQTEGAGLASPCASPNNPG